MSPIQTAMVNLQINPEPTVTGVQKGPTHLITEDLVQGSADRVASRLIGLKGNVVFTPSAVKRLLYLHINSFK